MREKFMLASVLRGIGDVTVEQRPVPCPAAGEVLIKVASVGVCGSDIHYYEHGRIGPYVVESPLVLGHEASGTIVEVGEGVSPARIGNRVAIEPQRPCRACAFCRAGRYNLCPKMRFYATPPVDGAFSEYVIIDDDFAYDVPDSISDDAAALMEPASVGIAAAQKSRICVGDAVLIAGAGPIGLITAQIARAFGAADIVVADIDPTRRELATRYGARAIDPSTDSVDSLGVDVFIDASGATSAITSGIRAVRPGGAVVLVGSADVVPLFVPDVSMREITIAGVFRYTCTWPIARSLVTSGQLDLDSLVTHRFGIEQVREALTGENTVGSLKRMVAPGVRRIHDPVVATGSHWRADSY